MLLSPRKNGLDSLFKEVRVFKVCLDTHGSPGPQENHFVVRTSMMFGSGMARVRLADLNGPLQAKMDQNGPFWSILVARMVKSGSE